MTGIKRFLCITVAVKDQEEALQWYTEKLGFRKHTDMPQTEVEGRALPGPGMRFLSVSPPEQPDLQVILASWFPDLIGKNPTAILSTDDCQGTYEELKQRGVTFTEAPQPRPFACRRSSRTSMAISTHCSKLARGVLFPLRRNSRRLARDRRTSYAMGAAKS